jgi:hypothetical protein
MESDRLGQAKAQPEHPLPGYRGHQFDRVHIGGESRNHLGDLHTRNITYNFGAHFGIKEEEQKHRKNRNPDAVQYEEKKRLEREQRLLEEEEREEQRLAFLKALSFDAMDSRLAAISPNHLGTCSWIVESPEYVRWREESSRLEHHGVLWIRGNPGSGKSTLMKHILKVAMERDKRKSIISFFFNARGQSLEKSAEGMYRSLLYQLLSNFPYLYSDRFRINQQRWPIKMLENMLWTSVMSLKPNDHPTCYIDALDECTQEQVRDVVELFEDLADTAVSQGKRLSICFASRHYPHITMHKSEELKLDNRGWHLGDISIYVHSNMRRLSIPSPTKAKIEADIERRSGGIFLWAVLVIKILRQKHDDGASISELMESLAAVPDKLGSLFANILAHADQGTITAFQWVIYALKPLTSLELYHAIKTSTGQIMTGEWDRDDADEESINRFITRSTRGLVEAVKIDCGSGWSVQFIHESAREHLLQGGLASLSDDNSHPTAGCAHAQIARCCLSYIQLDSSEYLQTSDTQQRLSFPAKSFPLLYRATTDLLYHADNAYKLGALPLAFLSELPMRLLICSSNILTWRSGSGDLAILESATILFLLLIKGARALAGALLAACSKTETAGIVTCETTGYPAMTFDLNVHCQHLSGAALGAAIGTDRIELVQQVLHLGGEVVPLNEDVCSPLICAVRCGSPNIVELVLQHGADINVRSKSGLFKTALRLAKERDMDDVVSVLLAHSADLDLREELEAVLEDASSDRNMPSNSDSDQDSGSDWGSEDSFVSNHSNESNNSMASAEIF